jgi:hypothetical protein
MEEGESSACIQIGGIGKRFSCWYHSYGRFIRLNMEPDLVNFNIYLKKIPQTAVILSRINQDIQYRQSKLDFEEVGAKWI